MTDDLMMVVEVDTEVVDTGVVVVTTDLTNPDPTTLDTTEDLLDTTTDDTMIEGTTGPGTTIDETRGLGTMTDGMRGPGTTTGEVMIDEEVIDEISNETRGLDMTKGQGTKYLATTLPLTDISNGGAGAA